LFWCRLASVLGQPIYQLKQTLPVSEVRLWIAYFDSETERYEKIDWYLAQIAMEIRMSTATKRRRWNVKDFLLKFGPRRVSTMSVDEIKQRVYAWVQGLAAIGRPERDT